MPVDPQEKVATTWAEISLEGNQHEELLSKRAYERCRRILCQKESANTTLKAIRPSSLNRLSDSSQNVHGGEKRPRKHSPSIINSLRQKPFKTSLSRFEEKLSEWIKQEYPEELRHPVDSL